MPNRWVSPTGTTDPAGGSELNPWTYAKAMNPNGNGSAFYSPGDQIFLQGGTYTLPFVNIDNFRPQYPFLGGNGSSGSPIIIKPKPGSENAVILTDNHTLSARADVIPITGVNGANNPGSRNYIWWEGLRFRRAVSIVELNSFFGGNAPLGCRFRYCTFDGQDYPSLDSDVMGGVMVNAIHMVNADSCVAEFNHIHDWAAGTHENQADILTYYCKNCQFQDNYTTNTSGGASLFEKVGGQGCIWRRNYCSSNRFKAFDGCLHSDLMPTTVWYTVEHNVLFGLINPHSGATGLFVRDGCRFSDNLIFNTRSYHFLWTFQTKSGINDSIYNNVIIAGNSPLIAVYQEQEAYNDQLYQYFNHNIYSGAPQYDFPALTPQGIQYMRDRGWELNSESSVSQATIYDGSWNLKSPYTTRGRFGTGVGPRNASNQSMVGTIMDTTRYGAAAYNGGSPPPPPPPVAPIHMAAYRRRRQLCF